MGDVAIRVEQLSKRYRIGELQRYKALRDTLTDALYAPFRAAISLFNDGRPSAQPSNYIWALEDVSFEVKHGEVIGIIGRNGAGKSTLLKVLSRITEPTTGYADIRGRVGSLLEVGTGFHPELTGRENIYLNGAILGMKKAEIERQFDKIVAFAEVEKFIDTPVKFYSSGMYVRLAFAVAAHLEPEILLVDEVLAVGDAAFQTKCLGKMGEVAKQGRTVLFVSHNMTAVRALCGSAMLLEAGQTVGNGPVGPVIDRYLQASVGAGGSGKLLPHLHRVNTGELWIDQATLTNGTGEPVANVRTGEPFTLTLLFEVKQPVQDIRIGVGFNTLEGVRVADLHHTDEGLEMLNANPGIYGISLTLVNPLLPGSYTLSVGAHRALASQAIDYIPEAIKFHVLDTSTSDETYKARFRGFVRFSANWSKPRCVGTIQG